MQTRLSTDSRRGVRRTLILAERLLVAAGAVMLIWSAAAVADGVMAQRAARQAIEAAGLVPRPAWTPPLTRAQDLRRTPAVPIGSALAAIWIPRVDLSAVVLHGSDTRTLRRGPGHLENTPFPGQPGNVVIAGHRDSFFRPLRHVALGDDIFLDTPDGRFHYRVTSMRVVEPTAVEVLEPTEEAVLTLITCYPFSLLGNAPDRFVVRALAVRPGEPAHAMDSALPDARLAAGVEVSDALRAPVPVPVSNERADDGTLVRQAVERFRAAYNARAAVPIPSQTCDVSADGDGAEAICRPRGAQTADGSSVRIFTLVRSARGWAIVSVELQ